MKDVCSITHNVHIANAILINQNLDAQVYICLRIDILFLWCVSVALRCSSDLWFSQGSSHIVTPLLLLSLLAKIK